MNELSAKPDIIEIKKPEIENFKSIKPESDISVKDARSFVDGLFEGNNEQRDGFHTTYEERLKYTPNEGERGKWENEPGESKFIPSSETDSGQAAKEKLAKYDVDGIEYVDAEPDFSPVSEATVEIDNMTGNRMDFFDADGNRKQGNFTQADIKCAEKWSEEGKDGKSDWTARDVNDWRKDNNCSWHERCDTKKMDLVSQDIHGYFNHSGGVSECKTRDSIGGGFDE
jgi:hypothetical protein